MRSPIRCGNRAPIAGQSLYDSALNGGGVKAGAFRVAGGEGEWVGQSSWPCLCARMAAIGQKLTLGSVTEKRSFKPKF